MTWSNEVICDRLTRERLRSYTAATSGDLGRAVSLYEWNMQVAAAVMTTTAIVEVVVRNALDAQLQAWATRRGDASWFDTLPLDAQGKQDVAKARDRATRKGATPEVHGKVIAELSFGFWRYLVASRYLTALWIPALHHAFPHGQPDLRKRRADAERHMQRLAFVRNRAAHHEPIHRRNLHDDLFAAIDVTRSVCPDSSAWLAATSPLSPTIQRRP